MSSKKMPEPLLKTPEDEINGVEKFKRDTTPEFLHEDFRNYEVDDVQEATEQVAKSHGIYLEYNRAKTGKEKDWMYMVRISVPGGGSFTRDMWQGIDECANKYTAQPDGKPTIRLTNRQNIQFHWVKKQNVANLVADVAKTGFFTLNGCGDNTRNVMGCPLSKFSDIYDANEQAHKYGAYFQLPPDNHVQIFEIDTSLIRQPDQHFEYGPKLLNRKFKIAFSAVHRNEQTGEIEYDNCVEARTNDTGIAPIIEDGKLVAFQVYIGGGQGEKNGKPTYATLGRPLGIFAPDDLMKGLDSIVKVHQEWGDRKNRHWARLKYVVAAQGIPWYQDQIKALGAQFEQPNPEFDPGARKMHHGWVTQPSNGLRCYGAYIENGRMVDGDNGQLKAMVRHAMDKYDGTELMITPNQDLLFTNLQPGVEEEFEADLKSFGYGQRNGKAYSTLRVLSGACVGLDTCRLAYTESEGFEPELLDQLDDMGYGDVYESIGITGCERQCFRPATKTFGLVGQGPNMYALKLGGCEDGSSQGQFLSDGEKWYLRQVPRDQVANLIATLIDYYQANKQDGEDMGRFHQRVGAVAIIEMLKANEKTAPLMEKTKDAPITAEENCMAVANA